MMNKRSLAWFPGLLVCTLILLTIGCGGQEVPDDLPDLTPYTVEVIFEGGPVEGADVLFSPVNGQYAAAGMTDKEGKAVMKTDGEYEGVVPGEYKVSVSKTEAKDTGDSANDSGSPSDPEAYAKQFQENMKTSSEPKVNYLVPKKYSSFDTSELTATVSDGGTGEETFSLSE